MTALKSDPTFSVIICAYTLERWSDLVEAVASVQRQTRPPLEILVVVDSNPLLLRRVGAEIGGVVALENSARAGLSGARNVGINAARGDVVAFLDDDAAAAPDWLDALGKAYAASPRVMGVGGFIEPVWRTPPPTWFPVEFRWVVGCSYRGLPRERAAVRNLIGANMSLRRSVFQTVGGFRGELGHVGKNPGGDEETELCIRVRQRWPDSILLYEPRARVRHQVPAQRTTWRYFRARCYAEGRAKARVSRLVGSSAGLASERAYTSRTLPTGVLAAFADAWRHADVAALSRAAAIVFGLAITTVGYVVESLTGAARRTHTEQAPLVISAAG